MNKPFFILSIDGGGIRGVFPAHILERIQEMFGKEVIQRFDLIAGTSTGSIIAAAIACGLAPDTVLKLYRENGATIFTRKSFQWWGWQQGLASAYDSAALAKQLADVFGDMKLKEVKRPVILPATDVGNGGVHVFKSPYSASFVRDPEVPVKEAVLASCSAPTFFDPATVGPYLLADGGLWANNPALVAYVDAQKRFKVPASDIKILSLGCGHSKTAYGTSTRRYWGLLNGWRNKEFIAFLLSLQAQSTQNTMGLLLKPHQLLRLDFESDTPLPLDDVGAIQDLESKSDLIFTHNADRIRNFFNE